MSDPQVDVVRDHPLYCEECDRKVPVEEWLTSSETTWHFSPDHATTVAQTVARPPDLPPEAHQIWTQRETLDEDQRGNKKTRWTVYFHFPEEVDDDA